ncbi:TonB-dependent siderophore receptor [Ottowia thiooxydans]|uniref:Outer membrane receptor for ferric coprogen and ferric-rhodotorulic acid n=1 Tax=Ottowia thiooxydans TaxID=219182 RepID=A0ABV2Q209_9BURK
MRQTVPYHPSIQSAALRYGRRSGIALAVAHALAGVVAGSIALAATSVHAQPEASRSYSIPAGPLTGVLNRFGREAGIMLSFSTELTNGLQSPGLSGAHTVSDALRILLVGAALQAVRQGDGGFLVQRMPSGAQGSSSSSSAGVLPEVKVTAQAERSPVTEGSQTYKAEYTNTATKLSLTPIETPQTVTVVTRQQMEDFGMTSVDDVLKSVSGAFVADQGGNGSMYYSRGFAMQSQYDGTPNPVGISNNNRNPQIDNAILDRVEVLQGAAGLLTGAGAPGGTINLVRKRPTETFQAHVEAQLSSWNGRRIVGDISGPFAESARVRGRLVVVADNSQSFVDYAYRNRRVLYGVVEADLTSTTMLDASVQYQRDVGRHDYGAPFAGDGSELNIPRSSFFADGGNRTVKEYTLTTLGLTQRLPGDWQAKATFTHGKTAMSAFRDSYVMGELDVATGEGLELQRQRRLTQDFSTNALDVHASGPFHLFGRKHEAAFGLNGSSMHYKSRGTGYAIANDFNVYSFDPMSLDEGPEGGGYSSNTKTTQLGAYGVARFNLNDSLKLITGIRVSNYKELDVTTGLANSRETGVISPYAGVVLALTPQTSVYASYSDIFNPQAEKNVGGSSLKPVVGSNYEVGIKGDLFDKRLHVAAALFRLEQTNLPREDSTVPYDPANPCGGTCYVAADKVVSQGISLSASGLLAPGWNVAAGYTLVDSKYASGGTDGQRYSPELPRHSLRLSTAYALPGTSWTLGGTLTARSKVYRNDSSWTTGDSYTIRSGGLLLVGLMAKYQITPKTELVMAVSNLFDRKYRAYLENKYYSTFGEPRRITINLKYRF